MNETTINVWVFPESDFADWCELVGTSVVGDYAGYMAMLAAVQADIERQGLVARRVPMTVAEMRDALAANHWPNTPDNRAAVIAARRNPGDAA